MLKILALIITTILSALSIVTFDNYPKGNYNQAYDFVRIIGPGITYSFFLILFLTSFRKKLISYVSFVLIWAISFMIGFASFGTLVPVVGAIACWSIDRILNGQKLQYSLMKDPFLWVGGLSSIIGFYLFYLSNQTSNHTFGFAIMWIIILWQLALGILLIVKHSR